MSELESLKTKLQEIVKKTNPTIENKFLDWDWIKSGTVAVAGLAGGLAAGWYTLGVGAAAGATLAASTTALILNVGQEVKQEYKKSEWVNGGKINYVNFLINVSANAWIEYLNLNPNDTDVLENLESTINAWQDYFVDKFNGVRFLGEDINEVVTQGNIESSWFISNYSIGELLYFKKNLNSKSINTLEETIKSSIINKKFKRIFGVNHVIAYVIENGFNLEDISRFVSNSVQQEINSLSDIQITINSSEQKLFTIGSSNKEGNVFLKIDRPFEASSKEIPVKSIKTIARFKNSWKIDGISDDVVLFPSQVYGDGFPEQLEALDILKNDNSLVDKDIRTYDFKYHEEQHQSALESLNFFGSASLKPEELIKANLENKYIEFIISILIDFQDDGELDSLLTTKRNKIFDLNFTRLIYGLIAVDKEIARRVQVFNNLADATANLDPETDDPLTSDQIRQAESAGAKGFIDSKAEDSKSDLTEEQIKDRQRFYKQCSLLLNMHRLAPNFEELIIERQKQEEGYDGPNKLKPFGGRFWRATSKNKEALMTNLVSSKDSSYMFEIPPHVMTQLTPKFKLFKVMNDQEGKLVQTEFIFPAYSDIDRQKNFKTNQGTRHEGTIPKFLEAQFDKGDGIGLKSFSIDFNGTTPAEARNDIKGEMTLFFQSFADFTRTRISSNGKEYRFVDLIIQPKPDKSNTSQGIKISSLRQYEPTFYRIRVDMGYNIPKEGEIEGISSVDHKRLVNALKAMNKSFYLCMIDHNFNINNDGTVVMNFTYRAYIETALKSLRFDALVTPELAKKRIENENELFEVASSNKCTKDELKELQLALAGSEEELILNSLNSILTRLYERNKIFNVQIENEDRKFFLKKGFFRKCEFLNEVTTEDGGNTGDLGVALNNTFLSEDPEVDFERSQNDTNIQFFFFGDLLHTILDALFDPYTRKVAVGLENTKIVLGSFDFDPYQGTTSAGSYNIASIPISVDFFSEWFRDNVISQRETRRTFPILNFIRNLSNYLVSNALLEACVNRNIENRLLFQTGQISVVSEGEGNLDPIGRHITARNTTFATLDTDRFRKFNKLPLNGDVGGNVDIENFYHYIVLNTNGSSLTYAGSGKYQEDIEAGRFHVEIGSNRGIVKTVQFSKTDMQYLREARFVRNGTDGLLQLSSVYTANMEMYGNTLFYPGMELWINPYGFGGLQLGKPQEGLASGGSRSLANMLGIGGYHTITSVSTTLSPSGFITNIGSQHYYSGDGEPPETTTAKTLYKSNESKLIDSGVTEDSETRDAKYCEATILESVNFSLNNGNVQEVNQENIEDQDQENAEEATTPPESQQSEIEMLLEKYREGPGTWTIDNRLVAGEFQVETSSRGLKKLYFYPNNDKSQKIRINK